jgi:hypothetical protein
MAASSRDMLSSWLYTTDNVADRFVNDQGRILRNTIAMPEGSSSDATMSKAEAERKDQALANRLERYFDARTDPARLREANGSERCG